MGCLFTEYLFMLIFEAYGFFYQQPAHLEGPGDIFFGEVLRLKNTCLQDISNIRQLGAGQSTRTQELPTSLLYNLFLYQELNLGPSTCQEGTVFLSYITGPCTILIQVVITYFHSYMLASLVHMEMSTAKSWLYNYAPLCTHADNGVMTSELSKIFLYALSYDSV